MRAFTHTPAVMFALILRAALVIVPAILAVVDMLDDGD